MTLVGPSVTKRKAREEVNAAGASVAHTSAPNALAKGIISGAIILPVNVLLEKNACMMAVTQLITANRRNSGRGPRIVPSAV
ncbi:hypothetical protein ES703_66515 [subsurface metagenome]